MYTYEVGIYTYYFKILLVNNLCMYWTPLELATLSSTDSVSLYAPRIYEIASLVSLMWCTHTNISLMRLKIHHRLHVNFLTPMVNSIFLSQTTSLVIATTEVSCGLHTAAHTAVCLS